MERRVYLQTPGPTNIPERILRSLSRPNMNSRGAEFLAIARAVMEGLKYIFQTDREVVLLPGSGSGAMEAAVVNVLSPGDHVLSLRSGQFANRFAEIAEAYGMLVETLDFEWGEAVDPTVVRERLVADHDHEIRAILVTHNETSTAVTNDVRTISELRKDIGHPALLLVDAVSSLGCINLPFDEWELDVVVSGAQKGLMLPPGLALLALSDRAWEAVEQSTTPRWYWDLRHVRPLQGTGRFPYTPPQTLMFGMQESLAMFREEGLENVFARHQRLGDGVRAGAKALGLRLLADPDHASNSVTAILVPEGITFEQLSDRMHDTYGVILGGGLGKLAGKAFRIGHMGALLETDIFAIMGALEGALVDLGVDVGSGGAVEAARQAMKL